MVIINGTKYELKIVDGSCCEDCDLSAFGCEYIDCLEEITKSFGEHKCDAVFKEVR